MSYAITGCHRGQRGSTWAFTTENNPSVRGIRVPLCSWWIREDRLCCSWSDAPVVSSFPLPFPAWWTEASDDVRTAIYTLTTAQHIYRHPINNQPVWEIVCKKSGIAPTKHCLRVTSLTEQCFTFSRSQFWLSSHDVLHMNTTQHLVC